MQTLVVKLGIFWFLSVNAVFLMMGTLQRYFRCFYGKRNHAELVVIIFIGCNAMTLFNTL